ncbi:MAG: hypothetical protein KAU24_00670 [Candidatus Aenigmarchaeota archaeon]|nr:hypothetical protein [Candidatus Aenigmarchaeota archaeon]
MRFDVRCKDCKFFKKEVSEDIDCANNLGDTWDPENQACDNFIQRET